MKDDLLKLYERIKPLGLRFNIYAGIVTLTLLILAVGIVLSSMELGRQKRFVKAKESELKVLMRLKPNAPSQERIQFLDKQKKFLVGLGERFGRTDLFWKNMEYKKDDRFEFKEDIYALREALALMAVTHETIVDEEARLPTFEEILPQTEKLPGLFMGLKLSAELHKTLLEGGIKRIAELNFPESEMEDLGEGFERHTNNFYLKAQTNWDRFFEFLSELYDSSHLWEIKNLMLDYKSIPQSDEGLVPDMPLHVEMTLTGTFFGRRIAQDAA